MKKLFIIFFIFFLFNYFLTADITPVVSRTSHFDSINTLIKTSDGYISTGNDGYVIEWDASFTGKHYQLSPLEIKLSVKNPVKNELAIYESDGFSIYKLSVWNLDSYELKYSLRYTDSITFLNYSAFGTYLITGTTAVDGLIFLDAKTGNPVQVFQDEISTPLMAKTNKSESTCIAYSSNGMLYYIDMKTGTEKAAIECTSYLEKAILFSNNMYLAGISYDGIHVLNAVTGEELCIINAENPLLLSETADKNLIYCEYDKQEKCYEIKIVDLQNAELNYIPLTLNYFILENNEKVTALIKNKSNLLIGSNAGKIYKFSTAASTQKAMLSTVNNNSFLPLIYCTTLNDKILLITKNDIYQTSIENNNLTKIGQNFSNNLNINSSENYAVLWTKNEKNPVYQLKFNNESVENSKLYSPEKPVTSLHIKDNKIIIIEGNSSVILFDCVKNKKSEVYNGTGLQDAILILDDELKENLIIAKSSSTAPKVSLISVNLDTKETVPLSISMDIVLTLNHTKINSGFFGIANITEEHTKKTEIFHYNLDKKLYTPVSYWTDEDTEVFIELFDNYLVTNIGRNTVRAINLTQKNESILQRQNALTKNICFTKDNLISLNTDSSISIYNSKIKYIETRHFTKDLETFVQE